MSALNSAGIEIYYIFLSQSNWSNAYDVYKYMLNLLTLESLFSCAEQFCRKFVICKHIARQRQNETFDKLKLISARVEKINWMFAVEQNETKQKYGKMHT